MSILHRMQQIYTRAECTLNLVEHLKLPVIGAGKIPGFDEIKPGGFAQVYIITLNEMFKVSSIHVSHIGTRLSAVQLCGGTSG